MTVNPRRIKTIDLLSLYNKLGDEYDRKRPIMGYLLEYLPKNELALKDELRKLVLEYNKKRSTFLFIYAAAGFKTVPDIGMSKDDYYTFFDCLNDESSENIDVLLETPGGTGDTAEEIAKFLHKKFKKVTFVIPGEAKSAGTILALSGDDILMTDTGSLGPIDAQMHIGRSWVSAHDYMEWVNEKYEEAREKNTLNPFDAIMVAQISPGELKLVKNSLEYAEDLVKQWLPTYKFKSWIKTETTSTIVTDEMKQEAAKNVAKTLTNHSLWRDHGRSIKIDQLDKDVGLKITRIDNDPELAKIVYRMHTIIRLLFARGSTYKIFASEKAAIMKSAERFNPTLKNQPPYDQDAVVEVEIVCQKCNKKEKFYLKFVNNNKIDKLLQAKGLKSYPPNDVFKCSCGNELDLRPMKEDVERKTGRKVVIKECGILCRIRKILMRTKNQN